MANSTDHLGLGTVDRNEELIERGRLLHSRAVGLACWKVVLFLVGRGRKKEGKQHSGWREKQSADLS